MNQPLFDALGFHWDRNVVPVSVPVHSRERVCFRFHRMLPEFVWDAGVLEGNPLTFPEVKTLLDGITVGGHRVSDEQQILNLAASCRQLLAWVRAETFALTKKRYLGLHALVARQEALEWGVFRGEGNETSYTPHVTLGGMGRYSPLPTERGASALNAVFKNGALALKSLAPFERGLAFFLFGALQQFFFDGNKRTSRLMMNGVLMSHGIDAISIPAAEAKIFNETMVDFYVSRDATPMMRFLGACHPDLASSPADADDAPNLKP